MRAHESDSFAIGMDERGVRNRPFFRCVSKFPMFASIEAPVADRLAARGINLPCATLLTEDDVDYAATVVRELITQARG